MLIGALKPRNRRKLPQRARRLPTINWRRMITAIVFFALATLAAYGLIFALDQPIRIVSIEGRFQRVSPVQVEQAVSGSLEQGFMSVDLEEVRERVEALPWVDQARVQRRWLQPLAQKVGNLDVVEQAAIAGALSAGILADPNRAIETAHRTAERLNRLRDAVEGDGPDGRWQGEVIAGEGLVLSRTRQGVGERRLIDAALLRSSEARRLDGDGAQLREIYDRPGKLVARDKEYRIAGPSSLVEAVMETGRRGIEVNRYKGLGEMNPDQLWDTTLDPEARSLLQVRVSHEDLAEETFSTLMGDLVEPRRDFIQANALNVANLDV